MGGVHPYRQPDRARQGGVEPALGVVSPGSNLMEPSVMALWFCHATPSTSTFDQLGDLAVGARVRAPRVIASPQVDPGTQRWRRPRVHRAQSAAREVHLCAGSRPPHSRAVEAHALTVSDPCRSRTRPRAELAALQRAARDRRSGGRAEA